MGFKNTLLPPLLPQMMDDGMITESELIDNGMIEIVAIKYSNAARGDYLRCFFNDNDIGSFLITDPDIDFPYFFHQPADNLPDGEYPVYIQSVDVAQNISVSDVIYAVINKKGSVVRLPPPVFSDAVDNMLSYNDIINQKGTHIQIPAYTGIETGDELLIIFYVENSDGSIVSGSQFNFNYVIEPDDLSNGFQLLIPAQYLLLVAKGIAFSSYCVHPISGLPDMYSAIAEVILFSDFIGGVKSLSGSSGYFTFDNAVIQDCYVKFFATSDNKPLPGIFVTLSINGENYFHSNGLNEIMVKTDINGIATAYISGNDSNINIITGKVNNNNTQSSIAYCVYRGNEYSTPWLVIEPILPTTNTYSVTLRMRGPDNIFCIIASSDTVIINNGIETQEICNIYLSQSEYVSFSIRSVTGGYCQLEVTDQSKQHTFCQVCF